MRVLVVDDEPILANWMADVLDWHGYQTLPLYNAREALDHLFEIQFDVALICITLPTISGDEMGDLYRMEVFQPACRVILFDRLDVVEDMKARRPDFECRGTPRKSEELVSMIRFGQAAMSAFGEN
jgi:DNA-binding response OmpR family regulator